MVLMRSGHREDAVSIAQEVLRTKPTDLGVLHALGAYHIEARSPSLNFSKA